MKNSSSISIFINQLLLHLIKVNKFYAKEKKKNEQS